MNNVPFANISYVSNHNPSFFHGWSFINFVESYADDALPIQTFADFDGPTVIINPKYVTRSDLENPFAAMMWVPLVIQGFATSILTEAMDSEDDIGSLTAPRWQQFRDAFCQFAKIDWEDIVDRTEELGIEYMAEYAVEALFIESGIHEKIIARGEGNVTLRVA